MAINTDIDLQKQVIYSIYVRNHTDEGTFNAIIPDLDRIRSLGTDIIWFMPIHPIGVVGHKGSIGCPYANKDYRTINPEYGTLEDFTRLVAEIHGRGMKVMLDVVYNHTSPDSTLANEHPDWFYHKADGSFGNKIGDWADVVDLDYTKKELWDYQIESLTYWAGIVDGYRCDVASFVPTDFWIRARAAVEAVHPGFIWLAETVHSGYCAFARKRGIYSASDNDIYQAFDLEYEYDIRQAFDDMMDGKTSLTHYADLLNFQEAIYPVNYNKMRYLENHDTPRICSHIKGQYALNNFTAWLYFNKGTTLIYAGQEYGNDHVPSLFDKDVIDRNTGVDISAYMSRLNDIKKSVLGADDFITSYADDANRVLIQVREKDSRKNIGIFCLKNEQSGAPDITIDVKSLIPDGTYTNLINNVKAVCSNGHITAALPVIMTI